MVFLVVYVAISLLPLPFSIIALRNVTEKRNRKKKTTRLSPRSYFPLTNARSRDQDLVGGRELGDSLGALRDGVLGELTGEHEPDRSLNLSGGESGLLVVLGKLSGLSGNALEDVVDEGVHDGHALLGDASVGVDLLQDLVDVRGVRFDPLGLASLGSGLLGGFCGFLGRSLCHFGYCGCWVGGGRGGGWG
jgi:hypothetical protein